MNKKRFTTYNKAVNYLKNNIVLCNNIIDLDDNIDIRFNQYDDDHNLITIFQFYITDCSEADVDFLENAFDLKFAYSPLLDLYILCVDHWGTSWDYVSIEVLDDDIPDSNL